MKGDLVPEAIRAAIAEGPVIQPVTNAPGTPTAEVVERFDSWLKAFETPWRAG